MPEVVARVAPFTAARLRRFRISVDDHEVARVRQDRSFTIDVEPGPHVIAARLDWHRGDVVVEVPADGVTTIGIEYTALITQMLQRRDDAFRFTVTRGGSGR